MSKKSKKSSVLLSISDASFLRELAKRLVDQCSVAPGAKVEGIENSYPFRVITPGGYKAVWVQDFTMNFSSGLIPRKDGLNHLQLILEQQNGRRPINLGRGVIVPPYAIADHINLDKQPVYFPGGYDPTANLKGVWGSRPPTNNYYDIIWLAWMLCHSGKPADVLGLEIKGETVFERLKKAFGVPEVSPETGLVHTTVKTRAVGFIFCDSVAMTGNILMPSLLRIRAADHLAYMADQLGLTGEAQDYRKLATLIRSHILPVFADHDGSRGGWLKASTKISSQPDVWGTIYALYSNVVQGRAREELLATVVKALKAQGEIEFEGALRHVPVSFNASKHSAWERTVTDMNRYQNGAYWHTPSAWLVTVLAEPYPKLAKDLLDHHLKHLRKAKGKVWECIGWDGTADQNPAFGPSITLPYGIYCNQL